MEIKNSISVTGLVLIASTGVIILILFFIIFLLIHQRKMANQSNLINEKETNHQKDLLNSTLEIAEQERVKIARNVHDDIGMMLHALKLSISKAKRNLNDIKIVEQQLDETNKIIESTIMTVRILSYELMPAPLINIGFIEGMMDLIAMMTDTRTIRIELITELKHVDIESKSAIHLYRLVKEIVNNVIKHTHATKAEVNINLVVKTLNIVITHNGEGVTNEAVQRLVQSSKGIGLKSIMGRAQLINATVQYVIVDDSKAKIIIEMPTT